MGTDSGERPVFAVLGNSVKPGRMGAHECRKVQNSLDARATSQQQISVVHQSIFMRIYCMFPLHTFLLLKPHITLQNSLPHNTARWANPLLPILQMNLRLKVFCSQGCTAQRLLQSSFDPTFLWPETCRLPTVPSPSFRVSQALVPYSPGPPPSESSHALVQQ